MDEEIDVEETMRKIKENIRKRKKRGAIAEENIEPSMVTPPGETWTDAKNLQYNLDYINSNYDIHYDDYDISSHRKILRPFLIKGRELVHGEVSRYVDVIVANQNEFNAQMVSALNKIVERTDQLSALNMKIDDIAAELSKKYDFKIDTVESILNDTKQATVEIKGELDKNDLSKLDLDYCWFEDEYRGPSDEIKHRQSIFVKYFLHSKKVLDIGCGRGEFLELLMENGVDAYGVDLNDNMVSFCKKKGLNVLNVDAISHLKSIKNRSLGGVYSGMLIEHLRPSELIEMIKLCYKKMKKGSYFVAETINPLCLITFANNFYLDPSHIKPVHPETTRFILGSTGFSDIRFEFFSPISEEARLSKIKLDKKMSLKEKNRYELLNQNIEKLNKLLYGYQDYAVIAKK